MIAQWMSRKAAQAIKLRIELKISQDEVVDSSSRLEIAPILAGATLLLGGAPADFSAGGELSKNNASGLLLFLIVSGDKRLAGKVSNETLLIANNLEKMGLSGYGILALAGFFTAISGAQDTDNTHTRVLLGKPNESDLLLVYFGKIIESIFNSDFRLVVSEINSIIESQLGQDK
jgi:hypothetical protein